jgi:lysophospholipase L1-like esterase
MRNKGLLYLAMGDSITWKLQSFVTSGSNYYATKIRNAIRQKYGSCRLINKGLGGTNTARMITNLSWLTSLEPDIVTIGIGTNDCVTPAEVTDATAYKNNLKTIIDRLRVQNPDVKIILCVPPRSMDATRIANLPAFRTAMMEVATEKNCAVCRFDTAWTSSEDATMLGDTNHPNDAGHTALFNVLWSVVQDVLENNL